MTLKTDIDQIAVDAGKLHDIVHGSPTDVVATEGGTVKSVAKAIADLEAQIVTEAGSYVDQCQDEVALATAQAQTATNQAAAAAGSALSAASVVSQDLSAIDRTVFAATLVDCFLYDTSKDSDGGAWRKRCAHTSWENETLSGNWLGSAANEAAARAISGATTGSYYYDTTAAKFYTLNAGAGKTETYRGNVRQFPAQVLVSVEAARVVLWDLTQAGCPMWMVFANGVNTFLSSSGTVTSVVAQQGILEIGMSNRLIDVVLASERENYRDASGLYVGRIPIASRNSSLATWFRGASSAIINGAVNDLAITVLPGAPVDVANGLPVPTLAVATDGNSTYSVTVFRDDGTVVNIASDSTGTAVGVEFDGLSLKVIRSDGTVYVWNDVRALTTGASPSATISTSSTPALLGTASRMCKRAKGSTTGVTLLRRNQLTLAASMLTYITKDYNSGWLPGDIRGAWLADTVVETLTGAELVTNGDFAVGTGWALGAGFSISGGKLVNAATAIYDQATQIVTTVAGKTYTVSYDLDTLSAGSTSLIAYNGYVGGTTLVSSSVNSTGKKSATFVAASTATVLALQVNNNGQSIQFDNVSCRLAAVDRSVKAKGLQVFGSLTKAVASSGAALVVYSGWSAANYCEQPFNSDLDFGTGDFCIMGWFKESSNSAIETVFSRGAYSGAWSGAAIEIVVTAAGFLTAYLTDDAYVTNDNIASTTTIDDALWKFGSIVRRGTALELWINGAKAAADVTITAATASLSNSAAKCSIGIGQSKTTPLSNGSLALWRTSATAPSAEQIKHIYETERPLFEANAQCCLAGTSNAVTALAYDEETDLLHVATSYGRSAFKGLVRVASEATPVGAIVALAAGAGVIAQAGASGADVYVPAYMLREELLRDAEQMARFGQNLVAHDFTATASQTTFALPVGWEIVAVYQQGAIKRETTSWTRSFDGFVWSVVLGTGATVSDWISILAKRV